MAALEGSIFCLWSILYNLPWGSEVTWTPMPWAEAGPTSTALDEPRGGEGMPPLQLI